MAYPVVAGSKIDQDATPVYYHTITFPASLNVNDLIIGVIGNAPNVTIDWGYWSIYSSSGNFEIYTYNQGYPYYGFNGCIICGVSRGGTSDSLILRSTSSVSCIARWQLYNITGHGILSLEALKRNHYSRDYLDGPFLSPVIPPSDDSVSLDYLYLQFVVYNGYDYSPPDTPCTTLVQPTNWTNLLHDGKDSNYEVSIASCRRETTLSQVPTASWNNDPYKNNVVIGFRVKPGSLGGAGGSNPGFGTGSLLIDGTHDSGATGFNIWVFGESIETTESVYINVDPESQYYESDGTHSVSNPYGTYIKVTSTGNWTSSWNTGTHFTAGAYSGSAGVEYISISCNGTNTSGLSYTDALIFDGPGVSTDSVNVEQYSS